MVIAPGKLGLSSLAALVVLAACATVPTGPTVPVLPGTGKSLDQFRADDAACQKYALAQVSGTTRDRTSDSDTQRRYDLSYIQCMYAAGHRVPVLGPMAVRPAQASSPPPPPPPVAPPRAAPDDSPSIRSVLQNPG
ncbi:MAG: glycine zipper family protein [Betaproteobacteria bacterium]|nr:glycine zipper family protein [Betaproteobacteria bacterium]